MMKKLVLLVLLFVVGFATGAFAAEKDNDTLWAEYDSAFDNQDRDSMVKLLTILHQRGADIDMVMLVALLHQKEDYASAVKILTPLHQRGDDKATELLIDTFLRMEDYASAVKLLTPLHQRGDDKATALLADTFQWMEDYVSAVKILTSLHQRGDEDATVALANILLDGAKGVSKDPGKAISMLRSADEKCRGGQEWGPCPTIAVMLGNVYAEGNGVAVNLDEAAKYYWKGVLVGDLDATRAFARLYKGSKGINMLKRALDDKKNSNSKMIGACALVLGLAYEEGYGVSVDLVEAVDYYWRAAYEGRYTGDYLTRIYKGGKVYQKDWEFVYTYACNNHDESWKELCTFVKGRMSSEQIRKAQAEYVRRQDARNSGAGSEYY